MSEHEQLVRKREMFDSICCSLLTQLESFEQVFRVRRAPPSCRNPCGPAGCHSLLRPDPTYSSLTQNPVPARVSLQVSAIDFSANDPAQVMEVQLWEKKNMPYKLPEDLKVSHVRVMLLSVRESISY